MAYDEGLLERLREAVEGVPGIVEKKMFGGVAFMLNGNMAFGPLGSELMVRVGPEAYADALARPHAREMDFTGRPMKGMVTVAAEGLEDDEDLKFWVGKGLDYAGSLPPK